MSITNTRRKNSYQAKEEYLMNPLTSFTPRSKMIKKNTNKNIVLSSEDLNRSSTSMLTEQKKKRRAEAVIAKIPNTFKNVADSAQTGKGTYQRTRIIPIKKVVSTDIVALALIEVRQEHSKIGNYNLVVGDLVMKQKERKELADKSSL